MHLEEKNQLKHVYENKQYLQCQSTGVFCDQKIGQIYKICKRWVE